LLNQPNQLKPENGELEMKIEKILKREEGKTVKLEVDIYISLSWKVIYSVEVFFHEKRKRIFHNALAMNDRQYQDIRSNKDREVYKLNKQLEHVTAEEIMAAKLELWEKLKPLTKDE